MPWFRERNNPVEKATAPVTLSSLRQVRLLAVDALRPEHFFLGKTLDLRLELVAMEEKPLEIYFNVGSLGMTPSGQRRPIEAWNLFLVGDAGRPEEPLLSLDLDAETRQLRVTRAIYSYVHEAYDAGNRVIRSRETQKWVRELVGTLHLDQFGSEDELRDEIACKLFQAVVGSSRLPITSVEAPLPGFSLGELAYFYRSRVDREATAGPLRSYRELIHQALSDELAWLEKAKLLETLLHAVPREEIDEAASLFMERWGALRHDHEPDAVRDLTALLRTLFNEVSLSPYTDLVDKTLAFVHALQEKGYLSVEERVDFFGHLLRQIGRHLTAYDLVTFHNRGANYPDALLLDAVLKAYLELADRHPELFMEKAGDAEQEHSVKRLRRRALRQGWLVRRRYEGHPVPDAPSSEGERTRVLPPPHVRVPEEQIHHPHRRTRRLYADDPLDRHLGDQARALLRQSIADLRHPGELRELGLALFLDRPLDAGKSGHRPWEPDQTLLLSYLAFSRSIARDRLQYLAEKLGLIPDRAEYDSYQHRLETEVKVQGIPADAAVGSSRGAGISLASARTSAADFVIFRTTAQSAGAFFSLYGFERLREHYRLDDLCGPVLILRMSLTQHPEGRRLAVHDGRLRQRLELDFDPRRGYTSRGGIEFPASPLRVLRVWEETDDPARLRAHDLSGKPILLQVR